MMLIYPAIFHKENDAVWAEFPDLEGCQTYADTFEECVLSAREALEGYAESVIERDVQLNKPSDIQSITISDENSFVMPIYCELKSNTKENKAVKKTLTIPMWLNERAIKNNINFSEILQNALIEKLYK